jgi:hypothetical protein
LRRKLSGPERPKPTWEGGDQTLEAALASLKIGGGSSSPSKNEKCEVVLDNDGRNEICGVQCQNRTELRRHQREVHEFSD